MKRFFVSDVHLFPEPEPHPGRGRFLCFLEDLASFENPGELWILGDLFDFWFEYRTVLPAGYHSSISAMGALSRKGWKLHLLAGNHDFCAGERLSEATGAEIHREAAVELHTGSGRVLLAHGDGLGPGDRGYRMLKPVLRSGLSRFLFGLLHPDLGTFLARRFSTTSRRMLRKELDVITPGLLKWVGERFDEGFDIVITGHTHLDALERTEKGIFVSLGDWLTRFTYCLIDEGGNGPELLEYSDDGPGALRN